MSGFFNNVRLFPGSSMVEQEAVNFEVVGSSPTPGAKIDEIPLLWYFLFYDNTQ